jgi:hypothetical protein
MKLPVLHEHTLLEGDDILLELVGQVEQELKVISLHVAQE